MNTLYRRINGSLKPYRILNTRFQTETPPVCLYHSVISKTKVNIIPVYNTYSVFRYKSKTKKDIFDSEDKEKYGDEDDFTLDKDSKVVKFNSTSLRIDLILKSSMGISRNKIEEMFYASKIRINGKKPLKKSTSIREDYEIDVIKSVSPKNPNHLYVTRINVLNLQAREQDIEITVRRFKNLLIENYEDDPYKGGSE